ncbi:energy-coupling factor ABC transporter permease [Candidatus Woesearchaeota archaeon]|nr:energy-coupling factor ABC transporter permease [Candidatus Woesearchaeota archaeon]
MHIPDGFLSLPVSLILYAVVFVFWVLAFRKSRKVIGEKHVPFLAVLAAAIFGAQMLNFSLIGIGGTSGHLLGAVLAAVIFGPYGALIIMTLVLVIQALFFADGGIVVFGANVFNMGIIGAFTGYYIYLLLKKVMKKNIAIPVFISAWLSVVVASFVCSLLLALSGTVSLGRAIIAMVPIHAVIGIGEGIITLGVILFIKKTRPDLLELEKISPGGEAR